MDSKMTLHNSQVWNCWLWKRSWNSGVWR